MSKQLVFTGTIANDKTGDALRNAFIKINSNFTELYTGQAAASSTGATAPTSPAEGWLWYNTTNSNTYIYTSGNWVLTNPAYSLPKATASVLGGVKVGANLSIDSNGLLSANANLGNLTISDQTITGHNVNGDIKFLTNGTGSVDIPRLKFGSTGGVLESQNVIEAFVTDYFLSSIVDYSTGSGDSLVIGTYGNINGLVAPWTVFELSPNSSGTPVTSVEINDILAGVGISPSTILDRGLGGPGNAWSNYVIVNLDLSNIPALNQPTPGAVFSLLRPLQKAGLDISANENVDIFLNSRGMGDVLINTNLLPIATNSKSLGSPTRRWKEIWVGPGSIFVQDETLGTDLRLTAIDGNFVAAGSAGLKVGEFTLHDNTIKISSLERDIEIGDAAATGNILFNRPIKVISGSTGLETFFVSREGSIQIRTPNISANGSAVNIIGSSTGAYSTIGLAGRMLHVTGNDGIPSRIENDAYGENSFAVYSGRAARGTVTTPLALQSGDTINRLTAVGRGTSGWLATNLDSGAPINSIDFVATENYTDTSAGSQIKFFTSPIGTRSRYLSSSIDSNGISFVGNSTGGITFRDSSRQTTAWSSSVEVSPAQITGLATVATSGSYSDLSNKPDVITTATAGTGISLTRSGSTLGINSTGVQTLVAASGTGQIAVSDSGSKNLTLTLPQAIATTSNVQFNNLTITGTITATNFNIETAPTSAGKTILLASGAAIAANIDQGGILLGPIGQSFSRSFLYDLSTDKWDTDGAGLTTLELSATDIKVSGQAHFGTAYNNYDFANATIQTDTNVNSYSQNVLKNHSSGSNASADFVAVNNIGDDSVNYIDVGINSSTFANVDYSIMGANSGYLYINGGDLSIGTQTATKNILFHTGGTTANKLRATISDTGLAVVGTVSATTFSGALSGNASTVTNGVYTNGSYSNPSWITALSASKVSGLATVATSGIYSDLTGKPTIPAAQVASDWNAVTGVSVILNKPTLFSGAYADLTGKPTLFSGAYADLTGKPTLATVATSGSYADLTNKPTFVSALTTSDGLSVNTAATGSVSITNTDKGSSQAIFKNIIVAGQSTVGATLNNDNLTLVAGTGMTITTSGKNITFNGPSQNTIKTISVLGDGTYTATAPDSSVIFAPSGRMSLSITGNTISITDNAKGPKKHRVKDKHGVYAAADVDMTLPEDTIEFIEGKNMSITTDAINKTITFTGLKSTRNAGTMASGTLTIDHDADDIVLVTVTGNITIAHTNMAAGREVMVMVKNAATTNRTITTGVVAGNMSNGDNTTTVGTVIRTAFFTYYNMGTTTTDLYCNVSPAAI